MIKHSLSAAWCLAILFTSMAALSCASVPAGMTTRPASATTESNWTPALKTVPSRRDCSSAAADGRVPCYQMLLASILKTKGIDSAMASLTQLAESEQVVRENSHMFAHSLGLDAFTIPSEMAAVFARCSPGFQSGCYHGVIQGYFLAHQRASPHTPVGAAEINGLCKDFRVGDGRWLLFQCAHGLGHGLELIYSHDLPRALAGCDLVADAWERPSCYGGAFMENIVSVTNPHQMAESMMESGGMKMDDDMAGMDMSDMDHPDGSSYKKFDVKNPLYPCSALDIRYSDQCYLIQTSLMLFENHGNFAGVAKTCETVPERFQPVCFVSLGRDANSYSGGNPSRAAQSCASATERFRPWCHIGIVRNIVDIAAHPADGFAYCAALTDGASKVSCYSAVGEEVGLLSSDAAKRREMCSAAPPPFDGACLYGAGVIKERPAGLVTVR